MNHDPQKSILNLKQALAWRHSLKSNKQRLVVTNGCFDLLHRGHVQYLYQARQLGDALLVLQNSDVSIGKLKSPLRPIIPEKDRAYLLSSLMFVDIVVIFQEMRCNLALDALKPDIYAKGGDYTFNDLHPSERQVLINNNTKCHFIAMIPNYSTTSIINQIKKN